MASDEGDKVSETSEPPRTTMDDHMRTYDAFMNIMKWGIVAVVLILVGLWWFLV